MSTTSRRFADSGTATVAPLSWQQQQIWLHDQWASGAPVYQETVAVHRHEGWREGPLRAMLESWSLRYAIVRTSFAEIQGEVQQNVRADSAPWDLHQLAVASRHQARQAAAADGRAPMDVRQGPLWRVLWARWPEDQELYLTLHHLIFDGYTLQRLWLPEWAAEYEARAAGQQPPQPASPPGYASYARWQRGPNPEAAERAPEHRDFWRRQLAGEWPRLEFGGDPAAPPFAANSPEFALDGRLFAAVGQLARAARVTPFMVLLAAFATLLHRLSGQPTMIIGVPAAGRTLRRWEQTAGPLVNSLALRLTLADNPPFSAVLRQTRDVVLEALVHQDFPFALAMREAPREATAAGLETYFSLQPPGEPPPAGWALTHLAVDNGTAKFPLHLDLAWRGDGSLEGRCRYQRARVEETLGAAIPGHWTVLLAGAVAEPDRRIGELPLLSAAQRRRLLVLGRAPAPPLPAGTVADIFAAHAAAAPESIALVALEPPGPHQPEGLPRRREIRYRQLQLDVEHIAAQLRAAGVQPGETVGVALPRSADAIVAMLAILWLGAAYLPLDLADPPGRQLRQLALASVRRVITSRATGWTMPPPAHSPQTVAVQPLAMEALRRGPAGSAGPPVPAEAAYVMSTSGSTGEPQAVRIPHRGIVRLVCGAQYAHFGADEVYALLAPLSFDASTFEIWAPLLNGGQLVIPPPGLPSAAELGALIRHEGVTTLWLTASWFNVLVDSAPESLAPLRQILTGGEALSPRHIRQALQSLPGVALLNGYGPTENTTFTSVYPIPAQASERPIPIGWPIQHTSAFVVDDYGCLAPEGAEGALWVGGAGLALECLGRDSSGSFFRPRWNNGEPLFATGDRARWIRTDAGVVLAFLGRRDQLIKLRGVRLELSGIEALLLRHPAVRQAAVLVQEAAGGRDLIGLAAASASADELSAWLARELPPAMIPARWVLAPELPRLPSGKLDRQALCSLARDGAASPPAPASPRRSLAPGQPGPEPPGASLTATERKLERIWARLLGRASVERNEDFYALGGHSLIAIRLLARVEEEFGCRSSVARLLSHRTIAAQARWIEALSAESQGEEPRVVPIQAGKPAIRPPFFSIEAIGRFLRLAEAMGPDQPWWGLRLTGLEGLPRPCPMAALAAYHLATLRSVQPHGPYYLAGFCQNGVVAFELAQQLAAVGERVACLLLLDAVSPAFLQRISGWRWPWFRLRYAWHEWRAEAPPPLADRDQREFEEMTPPTSLLLWRRWRYRWAPPSLRPRTGERTAVVQQAVRHYHPLPFPGRVLLFRSSHRLLAPSMGRGYDPSLGWSGLAAAGLEVHAIEGDHVSMFHTPGVNQMARVLAKATAPPLANASAALEVGG